MNLEQIDTSITAGKAEVMRLAAEGRRVVGRPCCTITGWCLTPVPSWNWQVMDYAIIAEPVGPEEMFVVLRRDGSSVAVCDTMERAKNWIGIGNHISRYIRADIAGEVKP